MIRNVDKYQYQCLNDAKDILQSIGMPERLRNPRSVMVFAACAEMKAGDTKWRNISEEYHGTQFIHDFINAEYPNKAGLDNVGYAVNSRETVRKDTIKPWIAAGIMEARTGIPTNDKNNAYRFTAHFSALVRHYGTAQWGEALKDYLEVHEEYTAYLKQAKKIERNYETDYCGEMLVLKKTAHNKLQLDILDKVFPLVSRDSKPELLYLGDATERYLVCKKERLKEIGITVFDESSKLPDIVAYDSSNEIILFIEAYHSGGAFTLDRVNEIKRMCRAGTKVAFITAFETTKKMLQVYTTVAWDTEMWTADEPTHLVHKNGDKFIGREI